MRLISLLITILLMMGLASACGYMLLGDRFFLENRLLSLLDLGVTSSILLIIIGFAALTGSLYWTAYLFGYEPGRRPHVILEQKGGVISISLRAIEDLIYRKGKSSPGVRNVTVKAALLNNVLSLRINVTLEWVSNISEFTKMFQHAIQYELSETLGIPDPVPIEILVKKIVPKKSQTHTMLVTTPPPLYLAEDRTTQAPELKPSSPLPIEDAALIPDELIEENKEPYENSARRS